MTPERWQEVKKVLAGALERTPEEQHVYLNQACADPDLRREVESLINAHNQEHTNFLEQTPVTGVFLQKGTQLGQYTLLAPIGSGGMGEVYRAHDTKLKRDVAIKVLPSFFSGDHDRLRRFEREARAAAALNHPNILAVHQMGIHEGAPYLVSELLEGSTLREQLKRGPMALRKVIDYGVQVARGLAAAHEKGVVHRDLKPENLFVTKDGRVKILDFGLAKLTQRASEVAIDAPTISGMTEPGMVLGTVGYMSPEQVSGKSADHRADIFALGAILYEMLTGKRAFQKPTAVETMGAILNEEPLAVSQFAPTTPMALQRVVQRCIEKNPEQRFQSVLDLAFALEALTDSGGSAATTVPFVGRRHVRPWTAIAGVIALLVVAAGAYFYSHRAPALTEKNSIVVADFTNTTGDPVFDGTLRQGLSAQLEQSPFFSIVSADRVAQTLRQMEKPPDTRLTQDIAREVCQRANATAAIEGSIAKLGTQYVIGLNAVNCRTGETLARKQVTADGKEKILAALGHAASGLRSKLGESRASLARYDVPLDQVTTASLDALRAATLGGQAFWRNDVPATFLHYRRAVRLDPSFATAHSVLGIIYGLRGDDASAVEELKKAYDLRGRVSEFERFGIESNYHSAVTRNFDKMNQVDKAWVEAYPRDARPLGSLNFSSRALGRLDAALAADREALRIEPTGSIYTTLGWTYLCLNRLDEARTMAREARARHLDNPYLSQLFYAIGFLRNDPEGMSREASKSASWMPVGEGDFFQSNTAAYGGRLAKSRELSQRAIGSASQRGASQMANVYETALALREALFRNLDKARKVPAPGTGQALPLEAQGNAALALALAGDIAKAEKLADNLSQRFPEATFVQFDYLPAVRAVLALQRGKSQESIENLRVASGYEQVRQPRYISTMPPPMITVYIRGQAYLAVHRGAQASVEFQKILDHPGFVLNSPVGALAHLGLARAYVLSDDTAKARTAYRDFLALWKDADPDIPILKQAKAEYAKLQ